MPQSYIQLHHKDKLKRCMRAVIFSAALTTLAGCGNSPSGQAQQDASSASSAASKLIVFAGDYRTNPSFSQQSTTPMSPDQLAEAKEQAIGNPSNFLAPRSPEGSEAVDDDLAAAQSLLSNVADNPDLADEPKSVINAQQATISMVQADRSIYRMQAALDAARAQAVNLNILAQQLNGYQSQIILLQQQQQTYAQANELDLVDAQQTLNSATQAVDDAQQKLDSLKALLAQNQQQAADYSSEGMIIRNESQTITGESSLDAFKQGSKEFNQAAVYNQKAQLLQGQVDVASQDLAILKLRQAAADAQVQRISAERSAAEQIAQQDAAQIVAIQTQARSLILGSSESGGGVAPLTLAQGATELKQQLNDLQNEAQKAMSMCQSAQSNLGQALQEVRSNYTISDNLTAHGATMEDPMVLVTGNHQPEALLQLLMASVYFRSAQINYLLMQAAQLQSNIAGTVDPVYTMVDQTSPLEAPASGAAENYRTKALYDLSQNVAMSALEQARMGYSPGQPPLAWLVPLMQFQIDEFTARIASDPSVRAQAIQDAAKAAAEANRYNASLQLELPSDLNINQ